MIVALFLPLDVFAQDDMCPLDNVADQPYTDVECQFLLGTTAYRAGLYSVAAAHWQLIVDTAGESGVSAEFASTVRSALAFLKYQGYGVPQNQREAANDWIIAVAKGDLEARRHLGTAFSDPEFEEHDPVIALAWFKSILLLHPDPEKLDETDKAIYSDALDGIEKLESTLSKTEIEDASRKATNIL